MKKNKHTLSDFIEYLFSFLYEDHLKIDQNLNAEERKKAVRKKTKKIWIHTGIIFLIVALCMFTSFDNITNLDWMFFWIVIILCVCSFVILSLLDSIKLLIKNRKIDKLQKAADTMHKDDVHDRNCNNNDHNSVGDMAYVDMKNKDTDDHNIDNVQTDQTNNADDTMKQAFFRQLDAVREKSPLAGAQLGAEDIWNILMSALKEPDGRINVKALLLWASGLAGYACQASAWEKARLEGKAPEIFSVQTKDGKNFYMGEGINRPLLSDQYSIWSLAAGIWQKVEPARPLPDIEALVKKSVSRLGNEDYKMWNEVNPYQMTKEYEQLWKGLKVKVDAYCKNPDEWPLLFGLVLQKALQMTVKVMPPEQNCLEMAMENALFTAKMDITKGLWK